MFQLLVLFFAFMRKRAWDYGRLALVNKDYEKYNFYLQNIVFIFFCICIIKLMYLKKKI